MNQKNALIILGVIIGLLFLVSVTGPHNGWGMWGMHNGGWFGERGERMYEDDYWKNEDGESMYEEMEERMGVDNVPTSADNAPPGSMHNLPVPEAVAAVRASVANELGASEGTVIILSAYEQEWSDSCLGLGGPAESCLFVITPGYQVTVLAQGSERVYRTNADGTLIRAE